MSNTGRTARLDFFSDGVFAIAITLLVIEIKVPHVEHGESLLQGVLAGWPSYLAYVVSFSTIGVLWLSHSAITQHIERANAMFVRLNLLLLMVVAFIPFPTSMLADYSTDMAQSRTAVVIYGTVLMLAAFLVSALWRYAVRGGLTTCPSSECELLTKQLTPSLLGYPALVVLGFVLPVVAVFGQLLLALFRLVPFGIVVVRKELVKFEGKEEDK